MKFKDRALRLATALAITGVIASQIPLRGETAFGSVKPPSDGYLTDGKDNSGSFLGIKGLTNRNVINGAAFTILGLGIYSTLNDSRAAAGSATGAATGTSTSGLILAGDRSKPIYDVAQSTPTEFSLLIKLIDDAELVTRLREDGPFTLFAPNNAGLSLVKPEAFARLQKPENKAALVSMLQKHIVKGRYTISDLMAMKDGTSLETLAGTTVIVRNKDNYLTLNGIPVVQNDIAARNGWIHPIETPLELP